MAGRINDDDVAPDVSDACVVEIVEVSARDGLQSDAATVSTGTKVEMITRAVRAGIRRVEAVSFVNPRRVPQMADADAVLAALPRDLDASYIGLVLNVRGLERALAARDAGHGVDEINVVVVCTDTFALRNQGATTEEQIVAAGLICKSAAAEGLPVSVTLSASFGCPYEGEVPLARLVDVAGRVAAAEPAEIALADSIGAAVPTDVEERIAAVRPLIGTTRLRCHFHDTRNTGLANAVAAVRSGVRVLDASLGGIGGCPFAPGATGNIATEDLVHMLERMGYPTGVDVSALVDDVGWIEGVLGHPTSGSLARAGVFPPPAGRLSRDVA